MTVAWYGHLKFREWPMWQAIAASWGLAFFEYCLQVPANRMGYGPFSITQLKVLQEAISLLVFSSFAIVAFNETLRWNHLAAFGCLVVAVFLVFL